MPLRLARLALLSLVHHGGWAADLPAGVSAEPFRPRSVAASPDGPRFTRLLPDATGLTDVNKLDIAHPMNYLYHSGMTCGGVAVADFDGDGLPDVFFAGTTGKNHLYRQEAGLHFKDITGGSTGLDGGDHWTAGAAAGDVDGDGDIDLYLCNYMTPNQLFLNMGKGPDGTVQFREVGTAAGLGAVDCSHSAAFGDYDGDGRLDLYLLTNRIEDPNGTPKEMPADKEPTIRLKPGAEKYYDLWRFDYENWGTEPVGTPDRLYHNDGPGPDGVPRFSDVTAKAGIQGRGDGLSVTWWDYDRDGKVDIYVGNDFISTDRLYQNNGDGTFANTLPSAAPHTPWFSMGADIGDLNNDLWPDLLVADMSATSHFKSKTTMGVMGGIDLKRAVNSTPAQYMRNTLLLNTGLGRFQEAAYLFKLSSTDWTWAVKFADFDLDGWQDVFFSNGISRHMNDSDHKVTPDSLVGKHMFDFFKEGEMRKEQNRAYKNTGHDKFDDVSQAWGLDHVGVTYGVAYADLDRDGDLDMINVNLEEPNFIFRNDTKEGNSIAIALRGTKASSHGLGATIVVESASGKQMRQLQPQTGYLSCNEAEATFGLGTDAEVSKVTIQWVGGGEQTVGHLAVNQRYTITQSADGGKPFTAPAPPESLFKRDDAVALFRHKDAGWDKDFTFKGQSLIPWALSMSGPAVAVGDVNGDGSPDFFMGGAAGEMGILRLNDGKGRFRAQWVEDFKTDKAAEDMGAVFFDADGDGDLDLFVASGANDLPEGSAEQKDRLYLNDGKGAFTAAPAGSLPEEAVFSSSVAVGDFDRDGKPDLFIGTRVKPQAYPTPAPSRLWHNESGKSGVKFADVTAKMAPEVGGAGLVTGSTWSDADGDGWIDLLVATEWGPIRLFHNEKGKLVEKTAEAGLADLTGYWNSVVAADVNHDGAMDYLVGNLGLNTKYKQPDVQHPMMAYVADFDGKGVREIVEVKREGDTLYPERGRSCSSRAMPFIAEKFKTFNAFATAKLEDIYTKEKLEKAEKLTVNEFQSGVLLNDGKGHFTLQPFERIAQIAPTFGMAVADFNGDGHADVYLAQNYFAPQIETGRFDGSVGQLMLGDGKGHFSPATPLQSGIVSPGDAKSAAAADLYGNGSPDFLVGFYNAPLEAWKNQQTGRWLPVRLPAARAAGARVTLARTSQPTQTVEVAAGSSWLSQSEATVVRFGLGSAPADGTLTIRWPNGEKTETKVTSAEAIVVAK